MHEINVIVHDGIWQFIGVLATVAVAALPGIRAWIGRRTARLPAQRAEHWLGPLFRYGVLLFVADAVLLVASVVQPAIIRPAFGFMDVLLSVVVCTAYQIDFWSHPR